MFIKFKLKMLNINYYIGIYFLVTKMNKFNTIYIIVAVIIWFLAFKYTYCYCQRDFININEEARYPPYVESSLSAVAAVFVASLLAIVWPLLTIVGCIVVVIALGGYVIGLIANAILGC